MNLASWIIIGAVAGWLAGKVVKGRGSGLLWNIVIGVLGALLGGWIAKLLNLNVSLAGFSWQSLLVAFGGSVILLLLLKVIRRA